MTDAATPRRGILLVNLGSPDSTRPEDVRRYLAQFLDDPRVLDIPTPVRRTILNLFILPTRPRQSAEAYEEIWTEAGSPLIVMTWRLAELLRERIDVPIAVGMRYGNPSTATAIQQLVGMGVQEALVVPLYPHYAMSSYETAVAHVQEEALRLAPALRLHVQPPWYNDPDYIEALAAVARPVLEEGDFDKLLFSYHGIPERHVRKGDPTGSWCLSSNDCCAGCHPSHAFCYRHQVHVTSELVARALGLERHQWELSFQSRLGSDPWLKPYTDKVIERFPTEGVKRLAVICPAFVSDCLETLEEINMRGRESFEEAGGKEFAYIPCLNDHPRWVDVLETYSRRFLDR